VAGVCGGLAQYFNLDATLIRILFIVLAVLGAPASCPTSRQPRRNPAGTVHLIPVALTE
jgi:hypothetical protein